MFSLMEIEAQMGRGGDMWGNGWSSDIEKRGGYRPL